MASELTVPRIDFSSLGELPQLYRQNQADAMRRQTLASLGQGGTADAAALMKSGDLSLAQLGMTMQQRQAEDAWRREEAVRSQRNADRSHGLQARAANRADDITPSGFVRQADGSFAPLPGGPQDPDYLRRKAVATAQAEAPKGFEPNPEGGLRPIAGGPADPCRSRNRRRGGTKRWIPAQNAQETGRH